MTPAWAGELVTIRAIRGIAKECKAMPSAEPVSEPSQSR